jgi:hypothetical protein
MSTIDHKGVSRAQGVVRVNNFLVDRLVTLIFRMEIKAKVPGFGGKDEFLYFNLGWCLHMPNVNDRGGFIDGEINESLKVGPGETCLGDMLWKPFVEDGQPEFKVKLRGFITRSEQIAVKA